MMARRRRASSGSPGATPDDEDVPPDPPLRRGRSHLGSVPVTTEVDEELAFHLEMQTRRFIAAGMSEGDAREAARSRFGDLARARAECLTIGHSMEARMRRTEWLHEWRQDGTYAWRLLRRSPGFAAVALLTLALGIGANTAIFSVMESVLLRPLPYRNAAEVRTIWSVSAGERPGHWAISAPEFADLQDQLRTFSGVSAIRGVSAALTGACATASCDAERMTGYSVSPNLFDVLGIAPVRGRGFTASDGAEASPQVALLGHSLWLRRYGGDSTIVGRTIIVNGIARTVIGVMPPKVRFPDAPIGFLHEPGDLWIPYSWERNRGGSRGNQILAILGRVRPGVSPQAVQTDLDAVSARFRQQFPDRYTTTPWRLTATSLRDQMVGDVRLGLLVLATTVGLVLLIAGVNVATLLLARGETRQKELAVRAALGAGRARIARQLLTESVLLAFLGGVLGVALAWWGVRVLVALDPGHLPRLSEARVNGVVLAYSLALALVTGLLFGLVPVLHQWRALPHDALQAGGRAASSGMRGRVRHALVVAEIAMALMVLTGAGLLLRSFVALQRVPVGFDPARVLTMQLSLSGARFDSARKMQAFARQLVGALEAIPGVERASAVYPLPMSDEGWSGSFDVEGVAVRPGTPEPHAEFAVAMPGYFRALSVALRAGRDFTMADDAGAGRVVVIDETLAQRYWPRESAIGKRINSNGPPGAWETVIGVVAHVHTAGPRSAGEPQIYLPYLQNAQRPLVPVARLGAGVSVPLVSLRDAVRKLDADLPVASLRSMGDVVSSAFANQRFNTILLGIFGAIALILASIGLYGVMTFVVAQRAHEIGIRLALGGHPRDVVRMVLREGLAVATTGLVIGLAATALSARVLSTLLFGVGSVDVTTYGAGALLLLGVALLAAYIPARRATRVEPLSAMRASA